MLEEIKSKIEKSKGSVDIGFGVSFSHFDTLKRIYHYQNSKYLKGDIDPITKKKKPFPNISRFRARIVAKMLDFDIKDIRVVSNNVYDLFSQFKAYLLEKRIKNWAKENGFGFILNEIVKNVSDYGSCVVMKIKGQLPEIIELKSIFFDPTINYLKDAEWIILEKEFTSAMIEEKKSVWKNVDVALDAFKNKEKIPVYYYFGTFKKKKGYKKGLKIYTDSTKNYKDGILLYEQDLDEFPFIDFHINKINGRWLGVGVYEELFEPQIRELTNAGLKARALEFAAKQIYQTLDKTVYKNLLSDVESGDVILGKLVPLPTETRGLAQFRDEEQYWSILADRLTFTYDVVRGESLPATTPATNATIQAQMATSVFDQLRENLAFQIVNFFKKYVLEDIIKESYGQLVLRFVSSFDDINKFDDLFSKVKQKEYEHLFFNETGFYPQNDISNKIIEKLKVAGLVRSIKIPPKFLSGLSDVDIIIDSEARNVPLEANNLNTLLQILANNLQLLDNPLIRSLIYSYAEKIGISPVEIDMYYKGRESNQLNELQAIGESTAGRESQTSLPEIGQEQGLGVGPRASLPVS